MVCSERELGLSDEHEGILVLPDGAPVGTSLAQYLGDAILQIDLTPNRADCLSMVGVAREVAALTNGTLREPEHTFDEQDEPVANKIAVQIADQDLCFRYIASVIEDVKVGPSPQWMQERLIAVGMRPINNVVDITNYVMLEIGPAAARLRLRQAARQEDHRPPRAPGEKMPRSTASTTS